MPLVLYGSHLFLVRPFLVCLPCYLCLILAVRNLCRWYYPFGWYLSERAFIVTPNYVQDLSVGRLFMSHDISPRFFVFGGAHLDQIGRSTKRFEPGQSNPGALTRNPGGVAGNIARGLAKLDWPVMLSTILGDDADGAFVRSSLQSVDIDISLIWTHPDKPTATYTALEEPNGALIGGLAAMQIYDHYPLSQIEACLQAVPADCQIVADTNLSQEALVALAKDKGERALAVCAVSGPKANRVSACLDQVDLLFCNEAEAAILAEEYADLDALPAILQDLGVKAGVITRGSKGVSIWQGHEVWALPAPPVRVRSTNGAGDCLAACLLHGLALSGDLQQAARYGLAGASLALMSEQAIPDMLSRSMLDNCLV